MKEDNKFRHGMVAAILLGLCFMTYSNSLHNNFLLDDKQFVVDNQLIRNVKSFYLYFTFNEAIGQDVYYRPMLHVMIMINYLLFGLNPFGFLFLGTTLELAEGIKGTLGYGFANDQQLVRDSALARISVDF